MQLVELDKRVYIVVPIDFNPSVKPLKWQSAYGLPELPEPMLFIYTLTAHHSWSRQNSVQGLNSPSQGTSLRKTGLFLCKTVGLLDVSPSINHA